MRAVLTFISVFFISSSNAEEVEVVCHCVNDCIREVKCERAYDAYLALRKNGSPTLSEAENKFLTSHKIATLEFVDWGVSQCGTVFGVVGDEAFRYDFEINEKNITKSSLKSINYLPVVNERKKAKEDDLCIFKL